MNDKLWSGNFGNEYCLRNSNVSGIKNNIALFKRMNLEPIYSAMEFGCGLGHSLLALKELFPELELHGIEINEIAAIEARNNNISVLNHSINGLTLDNQYEFVLTKGMLMYIPEEQINNIYKLLYDTSSKYICICEYYNPTLITIDHRGAVLHKRDYGKIIDLYPNLTLIDYGFVYHRDEFPQDDCTWFLFKK